MVCGAFWQLSGRVSKNWTSISGRSFLLRSEDTLDELGDYLEHGLPFPTTFPPLINPSNPPDALRFLEPDEKLYVVRIEFASPGFTDLAGLGTIIGHLKDLLLKLIELAATREERKLENQKRRIEIAREYVNVAKEMGYNIAEVRQLVRWVDSKQSQVIPLIEQTKITGVQVLNTPSTSGDTHGVIGY